jgi:hypothetical protein
MTQLGVDLSSIMGGTVGNAAMQTAAGTLAAYPGYTQNRARLAAVTHLGYQGVDFYNQFQPVLFILGCVGTAVGAAALHKRHKAAGEAIALYGISTVVSAAVAWFTRPQFLRPTPAPVPESAQTDPGVLGNTLAWADGRVDSLSHSDPGWESRTLARLLADLGMGTMDPATRALIATNAH